MGTCGPPCNPDDPGCFTHECHKWDQRKNIVFSIPDETLAEYCPPKECPENTCCPEGPSGSGPPGGGFGGGGGFGSGGPAPGAGPAGPPASNVAAAGAALKVGPNSTLGRFWSHPFGERIIVVRENPSHVWLFTARALYQEFWDVDGDGSFDKTSPSHVEGTLTRTGSGWQLRDLDGTVRDFDTAGRWIATRDRNGNTVAGTYSGGFLTQVQMPDGRQLDFAYHGDGLVASITEVGVGGSASRTWGYTWTGRNLTRIDRPDGSAWLLRYDDPWNPGYVTRRTLRGTDGSERIDAAREYDRFGNLIRKWRGDVSSTGPDATELYRYSYVRPWNPITKFATDPLGNLSTTTYLRDADSNVALVTSTSGDCSSCGVGPNAQQLYDDPSNPTRVTRSIDARGTETLFDHDGNGQLRSRTEAVGTDLERTTAWQYNQTYPSLVTSLEQPSSAGSGVRRTTWSHDPAGNVRFRTDEGVENGSAFSYQTATVPNTAGRTVSIDPPGYGTQDQTSLTYDAARGDLIVETRTDPLIGTTTFGYDAFNRRTSATDSNGLTTDTAYDALNRVLTVTQKGATAADDLVTTTIYNPLGDLFRTILPEGNVIEYGYDPVGRLLSIERKPDLATPGERVFYTLNALGQRTHEELQSWTGGSWQTEFARTFVYSSSCHLDKVIQADGSVTEFAYDCEGNLEREWDANHPSNNQQNPASRVYSYDQLDRLTTITRPWGGTGDGTVVTRYERDPQDHLVEVVDGTGTVSRYTYSDRDLLTEAVSEVSGTKRFEYNEHGKMVSQSDARGVTAERTLDALGRLVFMDYPDDSLDIVYSYDDAAVPFSKGRLTAITRAGESIDYRYDRFGRLTQDGGLIYSYDKNANRLATAYPGEVSAVYTHDFADRPSSLAIQAGTGASQIIVAAADYKPSGPLSGLALGNGLSETRLFDQRYLPSSIRLGGLLSWSYTTDALGNILAISDDNTPASSRTYGYQDYQYYLTSGVGPWGTLEWTYDRLGNRLTESRGGSSTSYLYRPNAAAGNSPQLASSLRDGLAETLTRYHFDAAGNLLYESREESKTRYRYDLDNRLTEIRRDHRTAASRTDVDYDGRGFLSRSTSTTSPGLLAQGWATRATYSSDGVLYHRAIERLWTPESPREIPATSGNDYLFYFSGRPIAQLSLRTSTSIGGATSASQRLSYLLTDHLGTPVLATDTDGDLEWAGHLEPFGADGGNAQDAGIFLRFPGQWQDETWAEAGLEDDFYYNVHRWYDPGIGRYTQADPLGRRGGPHPYGYVLNNPLIFEDPLGLKVELRCRLIGDPDASSTDEPFFWALGNILRARHCYLDVSCAEGGISPTTVSYLFNGVESVENGSGVTNNDVKYSELGRYDKYPVDPGAQCEDCDFEKCIIDLATKLAKEDFRITNYDAFGPNSNSFAYRLILQCGGNLAVPLWDVNKAIGIYLPWNIEPEF